MGKGGLKIKAVVFGTDIFGAEPSQASWEDFKTGFQQIIARIPSKRNLCCLLRYARLMDDRELGKQLISQIGVTPDPAVYSVEARWLEVSAWAEGKQPQTTRLWNLPRTWAHSLEWSPDGRKIFAAAEYNHVWLLDAGIGQTTEKWAVSEGSQTVRSIAVSQDGQFIAACLGIERMGTPGEATIWNAKGERVYHFKSKIQSSPFLTARFGPGNRLLVGGGRASLKAEVMEWSPQLGIARRIEPLCTHTHSIDSLCELGDKIVVNCNAGKIAWFSEGISDAVTQQSVPEGASIAEFAVSSKRDWMAVALGSTNANKELPRGSLAILQSKPLQPRSEILPPLIGGLKTVSISPDDRWIACGGHDGMVYILDAETLEVKTFWNLLTRLVIQVRWSPDSKKLVTASPSSSVNLLYRFFFALFCQSTPWNPLGCEGGGAPGSLSGEPTVDSAP